MRAIVEALVPRRGAGGPTPTRTPATSRGCRSSDSGSATPSRSRRERGDVPGLADAFVPYRAELRAARGGRLRRAGLPGRGAAARRRRVRRGAPGRAPPPAGRRVPGPDPGPRAAASGCWPRPATTSSAWATTTRSSTATPAPIPAFLVDFDGYFPAAAPARPRGQLPLPGGRSSKPPATCWLQRRPGRQGDQARAGGRRRRRLPRVRQPSARAGARRAVVDSCAGGWTSGAVSRATSPCWPGCSSLLLAPHVALAEAGVPVDSIAATRRARPRPGVRAALAYLRIAADPERLRPDDLVEVHRRPSRGLPQWIDKWLSRCRSIDDVRARGRTHRRRQGGAQAGEPRRRPGAAGGAGRGRAPPATCSTAVRDDVGLGRAMTLLDSTGVASGVAPRRPRGACSRWPTSTPTRRGSSHGCGAFHRRARPTAG